MSRLIFYLIILGVLYWIIRRAFFHPTKDRTVKPGEGGEEMVQDPQCQCYIPKSQSYPVSLNGRKIFFCSEDCYRKYLASRSFPKA